LPKIPSGLSLITNGTIDSTVEVRIMQEEKLSGEAFCKVFMSLIVETIYDGAAGYVNVLRYGAKSPIEEDVFADILKLRSHNFSEEQYHALAATLCQVQEHLLGWIFALIDGSAQPPGWPDELRLVNVDSDEIVCPEELEWAFSEALVEYRARRVEES
jgi:hypothetical protein